MRSCGFVGFGSWLCKNAAAPKRSRITFGQITIKDAKNLKLVRFCWSEKYHSRDLPNFCVFTHGVIPGSSHTQALGISSPGIDEARVMSLAIMENCYGALCRTRRVAEADSNLHC
jgi:hypothetical protein